jgi:hypothetical protein
MGGPHLTDLHPNHRQPRMEDTRITKASHPPRPWPVLQDNERMAWPTYGRTPWKGRNCMMCQQLVSLARSQTMDRRICQWVHHMSAKQEPHPPYPHTTILYHHPTRSTTLWTNSHGLNHRATKEWRLWHNLNQCRPWVLQRRPLLTMPHYDHRTSNCPTVPHPCLQMVRPTQTNHIGLRPLVYVPLWQIPCQRTRHQLEPLTCCTPTNGQPLRVQESVGRTIPTTCHSKPETLEQVPGNCNAGAQ